MISSKYYFTKKYFFALMIFRINWNPIMILSFYKRNKTLSKINETNLKNENLLEREDLQQVIVDSWNIFRNEIEFYSAVLIGIKNYKTH